MKIKKILIVFIPLFFIYLNSSSQINFQKIYRVSDNHEGYSIQLTNDGGYIIAGIHESFGADPAHIYLIKIDINGDTLWTKLFLDDGGSETFSIIQTNDGGYALAGGPAFLVMKTNANGDTIWTKCYGGSGSFARDIQQTYDGGYAIVGEQPGSVVGNVDIYLVKIDLNGDTLWTRRFEEGFGKSIRQTLDSGFIITGNTGNWGKAFLIKTDKNGDTLWTKAYGRGMEDAGNVVRLTKDSGYIIAGYTNSLVTGNKDVYLIKTDLNGDTLWTKVIGGTYDQIARDIQTTKDSGYIIAGSYSNNGIDVYLFKTNAMGDTVWTKSYGGSYDDWSNSVKETSDSGFILTGVTQSFGTAISSIYVIKTDSHGNSGCNPKNTSTNISSSGTTIFHPPFIVSSGGTISGTSFFHFRIYSGCITSTICTPVNINDVIVEKLFTISPNPSNGNFKIELNHGIKDGKIMVFNILGEKLFEETLYESIKEINFENILSGIYFITMIDGEKIFNQKTFIQ